MSIQQLINFLSVAIGILGVYITVKKYLQELWGVFFGGEKLECLKVFALASAYIVLGFCIGSILSSGPSWFFVLTFVMFLTGDYTWLYRLASATNPPIKDFYTMSAKIIDHLTEYVKYSFFGMCLAIVYSWPNVVLARSIALTTVGDQSYFGLLIVMMATYIITKTIIWPLVSYKWTVSDADGLDSARYLKVMIPKARQVLAVKKTWIKGRGRVWVVYIVSTVDVVNRTMSATLRFL